MICRQRGCSTKRWCSSWGVRPDAAHLDASRTSGSRSRPLGSCVLGTRCRSRCSRRPSRRAVRRQCGVPGVATVVAGRCLHDFVQRPRSRSQRGAHGPVAAAESFAQRRSDRPALFRTNQLIVLATSNPKNDCQRFFIVVSRSTSKSGRHCPGLHRWWCRRRRLVRPNCRRGLPR